MAIERVLEKFPTKNGDPKFVQNITMDTTVAGSVLQPKVVLESAE